MSVAVRYSSSPHVTHRPHTSSTTTVYGAAAAAAQVDRQTDIRQSNITADHTTSIRTATPHISYLIASLLPSLNTNPFRLASSVLVQHASLLHSYSLPESTHSRPPQRLSPLTSAASFFYNP